jgi:hypothetical protein
MFTKCKVFFLIVCIFLIAGTAVAAPFFQLRVGGQAKFNKADALGNSWVTTTDILSTATFAAHEYYYIRETNYDGSNGVQYRYLRSTDTAAYVYDEGTATEYMIFQTGVEGTTWQTQYPDTSYTNHEIVAKLSFGNLYVVRSYDVDSEGNASPVVYNHFVRGLGLTKEVDYYADNSPTEMERYGLSGKTLYATFTGSGLYAYDYATTVWNRIHPNVPEIMEASNSILYAGFTGSGLYRYNGAWYRIHPTVPAIMDASTSTLYAGFTGAGLYKFDGATWSRIHTLVPTKIVSQGSTLYATFTGAGVYKWNGAAWSRLSPTVPANIISGY